MTFLNTPPPQTTQCTRGCGDSEANTTQAIMGQVIKGLPLAAFWSNVCREEQRINTDVLKDSHCNKQSVKAAGAAGECFVGFGFDSVTLPLLMSSTNTQLYRPNSCLHTKQYWLY